MLVLFHDILRPDNGVTGSWHIELANTKLYDPGLSVHEECEILETETTETARLLTRIERAVNIFEKKNVIRGTALMLGILNELLGDEKNNVPSRWSLEWSRRYVKELREDKRKKNIQANTKHCLPNRKRNCNSRYTMKVTETKRMPPSQWVSGTVDGCAFEAEVFATGNEFGIDGSNVTKLVVYIAGVPMVEYDKGWLFGVPTADSTAREIADAIIKHFAEYPGKF